jgi:hypothetical protein
VSEQAHKAGEPQQVVKPLNGMKTHPLTAHAIAELTHLSIRPIPRSAINPGVADRLLREALVESYLGSSPYPTHKGRSIEFFRITDAGRAAITSATRSQG